VTRRLSICLALAAQALVVWAAADQNIVFVTGDDEYRSEYSMPKIAAILSARYKARTSVAYAKPTPQTNNNIAGLEALRTADLAVFFLRWRRLPDDQLKLILDYVASGKPLVGLRTATHSFQYPAGDPHAKWNDGFGIDVFGQRWIRHHGHLSTTDVTVAPGRAGHPILRGVDASFHVPSWLYVVEPLVGDCEPLLIGRAIHPEGKDYGPQPVAWTKTYKGARVFFTTLGHPDDFKVPSVRRLVVNGILWALGREVPEGGSNVDWMDGYDPPASGVPK
jgi:uncharacterized protein